MKERDLRPVYMGTFEIFKKSQQEELSKIRREQKEVRMYLKKIRIYTAITFAIFLTANLLSYFIK